VPKLDLGFVGGDTLRMAFADVTYRRVDPAAIGSVLPQLATQAITYVREGKTFTVSATLSKPRARK